MRRHVAAIVLCLLPLACTRGAMVDIVRGTPPLERAWSAAITADAFEPGRFVAVDGTALPYRLLAPVTVEPGRRYPLVVQLHGSGGIGTDNAAQIDLAAKAWALPEIRARYPAFVLVPQFAARSANYDDPVQPTAAYAGTPLAAATELIEDITRRLPIDRDRIYASGFSMGGSAAWLTAADAPGLLAAIVPVSGIAPPADRAQALRDLPILSLHGDADTENPIDSERAMVAAIQAAGGRHARLRQYAGLAHLPPGDFVPGHGWRWLFAQRRNPAAGSAR